MSTISQGNSRPRWLWLALAIAGAVLALIMVTALVGGVWFLKNKFLPDNLHNNSSGSVMPKAPDAKNAVLSGPTFDVADFTEIDAPKPVSLSVIYQLETLPRSTLTEIGKVTIFHILPNHEF